jgi:hypothetical protein
MTSRSCAMPPTVTGTGSPGTAGHGLPGLSLDRGGPWSGSGGRQWDGPGVTESHRLGLSGCQCASECASDNLTRKCLPSQALPRTAGRVGLGPRNPESCSHGTSAALDSGSAGPGRLAGCGRAAGDSESKSDSDSESKLESRAESGQTGLRKACVQVSRSPRTGLGRAWARASR